MHFNPAPSTVMHIDLNSAFASIEQQANPFLRGKPVAVAAYNSPGGCILAPSVEAKTYGVKTGMRVSDGKILCPSLLILENDPDKYRHVHKNLRKVIGRYTNNFSPKSIDEFVLDLAGYPCLREKNIHQVGRTIKKQIKLEVGDWIRVSIGIAPNRFLAKVASSLHKPDGLDEINSKNFLKTYSSLTLTDLPGINIRNQRRLNSVGIKSVIDFYNAPLSTLRVAFKSINSYYWHLRLRGYQIDSIDFDRKSFGNSYALPKPLLLSPILMHLTQKSATRMISQGYKCKGVNVSLSFKSPHSYWHQSKSFPEELFDWRDIYKKAKAIVQKCPHIDLSSPEESRPVHTLAVTCFSLTQNRSSQLELFRNITKKQSLVNSVTQTNNMWGSFTLKSASALKMQSKVHDRIAFGIVE